MPTDTLGDGAAQEGLREHIHCADTELLLALLTILADVSHNTANVQVPIDSACTGRQY